jgi:hypothetical protein
LNNLISLKVRIIATAMHFIFALPIGFMFLLLTTGNDNNNAMFTTEIATAIINLVFAVNMIILVPILSICEMTLGRIHPFIKINCKDVGNYILNSFSVFIILILCVISSVLIGKSFSSQSGVIFLIASLIIVNAAQTFYFINSVISAICALRGYRFKNRFIYNLFGDD